MIRAVILICVVATVASLPVDPVYTINVDGPDGRHVQMGEPGKSVSGYYTSRSLDGQMEYKTMYEADDKGFRVRGDHLPSTSAVAGLRSLENEPSYVFNYDARSHSHYQMGEPGKAVQGSFMYYDAQGRAQRVDYEADENGYRVKPVVEDKPVEISSGSDAEVIKAADPVAAEPEIAKPEIIEPVPVVAEPVAAEPVAAEPVAAEPVAAEPVAAEPVAEALPAAPEALPAAPAGTYFIPPEIADTKPADPVQVEAEPAQIEAEAEPKIESQPVKETKSQVLAVPAPFPGVAYYRGAFPLAQPVFPYSYSPYSYGYGYNYLYPGSHYVYAL